MCFSIQIFVFIFQT